MISVPRCMIPRQVAYAAFPAFVCACMATEERKASSTDGDGHELFRVASSADPVVLRLSAVRDSVQRGDPVEVVYLLHNRGRDTTITNPLLVPFQVRGPTGKEIHAQQFFEFAEMGDVLNVHLPQGGVVGRVVNLACLPYRTQDPNHPCQFEFSLDEPGDYRITARHFWLKRPIGKPDVRSDSIVSNEVRITILP